MTHDLAAALLRDVPLHDSHHDHGGWMYRAEVLTALSRALDPALTERAGEVAEKLRKADEYEPLGHDGWEAADLITALLAQNAALRAERDDAVIKRAAWELEAKTQKARAEAAEAEQERLEKHIEDMAKDTHKLLVAAEAKVEKLRGKIRDWEARIDACEWSTNSSLTEDIRAEMRATLTTEEGK